MWREYLGPDCEVYGVDIDPTCTKHAADGAEILIGDQSDPEFWAEFTSRVPAVDIVVDDGGHAASQQIPTLEAPSGRAASTSARTCTIRSIPSTRTSMGSFSRPLHSVPAPGHPAPAIGVQQHVASVHRYPLITVTRSPPAPFPASRRLVSARNGRPAASTGRGASSSRRS